MDLYKLPKDMLVKMITEIRKDVEKEYEIYKIKVKKAEEAGIYFQKCNTKDCVNLYAKIEYIEGNFFFCVLCEKEFCEEHKNYCESCDDFYCLNCRNEHLIFCDKCQVKECKFYRCGTKRM